MCSKMASEGLKSCAEDILEKNKLTRLKTATNIHLRLLDTIPILKFAAKIRAGGQNMKIRLENGAILYRQRPVVRLVVRPELHLMQFGVKSPFCQKLIMGAHLADLAFVQHDDLAGLADGREPVGDDDRAAAADQLVDSLLDKLFGLRIHGGSGFVQDQ